MLAADMKNPQTIFEKNNNNLIINAKQFQKTEKPNNREKLESKSGDTREIYDQVNK